MTAGMTRPTTLEQILWSARLYRRNHRNFVRAWASVDTEDFRRRALCDCDDAVAEQLRHFLAQFQAHTGDAARDAIQETLRDREFAARCLRRQRLTDVDMAATRPAVEMAFDQLMGVRGVASTIASKVLAVLNPELFVMWDKYISPAYRYDDAMDVDTAGGRYANFLVRMQGAARAISLDAEQNHGIADPSQHVRDELGLDSRCALAKLIDEYNFLTITRGEVDPSNPPPL